MRWRWPPLGGHNLLMQGPPGSGKTLLARALPGLLAPLTPAELIEVAKVYSVTGLLNRQRPLMRERPFRAPHHTISHAGLVGPVLPDPESEAAMLPVVDDLSGADAVPQRVGWYQGAMATA